jgi:hypothetical protein
MSPTFEIGPGRFPTRDCTTTWTFSPTTSSASIQYITRRLSGASHHHFLNIITLISVHAGYAYHIGLRRIRRTQSTSRMGQMEIWMGI